ncbi:MAG: hypothetical protein B6243_03525 [Anaerolineaceae bacterium 4572_5.2]|nr:MAG: hypothetical protein B6243_03525 [Anaerolineaceae bacterium 4572_5.2]
MAILCSNCGFNNPEGMNFCGKCGASLQQKSASLRERSPLEFPGVLVGPDLLKRFRKAGLEAKGERRKVTILFADLTDYTSLSRKLDAEDLYALIQQYIRLLMESVYRYEGMVDKILGDGIMALFGAPIAHENDTERAIRSALDMQSALKRLNWELKSQQSTKLQMHIGVNSGMVIAGGIGMDTQLDYTVIGDIVNLTQRLGDAATPGTILVSENVYRQSQKLFNYEKQAPLSLKGISEPITAYILKGPKSRPETLRGIKGMRSPLIGRQSELERLQRSAEAVVQKQHGGLVLVEGEAGVGKSRLVSEFRNRLGKVTWRILEGRSLTYRRSIPYWIILELLKGYYEISSTQSNAEIRARLVKQTSHVLGEEHANEILPYLEHLFSLPPSNEIEATRISYLKGDQLRQQIFLSIKDLLIAESKRQPLLLIFEDLHWADDASLQLIKFLLTTLKKFPILICGISRAFDEGELTEIPVQASRQLKAQFAQIKVNPLTEAQSKKLLSRLITSSNLPTMIERQIIQRSSGIPFFLEEFLRMLIDDHLIVQENGAWKVVGEVDTIGLPITLESLALTRFDRLMPEEHRILQVASVIGREFEIHLLAKVLETISEKKLELTLPLLAQRGFIEAKPKSEGRGYIFRHTIASDAIYKTLLHKERKKLHAEISKAIKELYADRIDEYIELLAHHYSWSTELDQALHYLILAGQKATRENVNSQAQKHYEQAAELLPRVEHSALQEFQIQTGLASVSLFGGKYEKSREHYHKALNILEHAPETIDDVEAKKVEIYRKIGTTFERQGDFQQALSSLEKARDISSCVKSEEILSEQAQIQNDIGWLHFRQGELEQAENCLRKALDLVEGTYHYSVVASILNRLGGVYYQKDDLDQASNYVRKSLVLREEIGDTAEVARSYNNLGLLNWKQGNWDRALENFERSVEFNESLGDVEAILLLYTNIGLLETDRGNLQKAFTSLNKSLDGAKRIGHRFIEFIASLHLSRYYLTENQWEEALAHSVKSAEICEEIGAQEHLPDVYWCQGAAWLKQGNLEKAEHHGKKALIRLEETDLAQESPSTEKARVLRLLGTIALRKRNLKQAKEYLEKSAQQSSLLNNQLELGRTTAVLAELSKTEGDTIKARLQENEARLIFQRLGAQLDLEKLDKGKS